MRRRQNDIAAQRWRLTLEPGDLVWATFYNSAYAHICRLRKPKAVENEDRSLWDAAALCGGVRKYYGRPIIIDREDSTGRWEPCKRCVQRHRALGEPQLAQPAPKAAPAGIWLAFGWGEVPAVGIEFDLGKDGDPQTTADDTGKVWGEKRTERQRWQRGTRYVRICELFDGEYRFTVCYGVVGDPKSDSWNLKGNLKACLARASRLMALGGQPGN